MGPTLTVIPQLPQLTLFAQDADDQNMQVVAAAWNALAAVYLDWFNTTGQQLAYWPALSGAVLDWVALGVYGIPRPTVGESGVPPTGTLNTELLNVEPLNTFTPGTSGATYSLSDDVFQRVLTWNLYVGDGFRFSFTWLKRRIMRFFVGVNGVEPTPWNNPVYTIGTENTTAISVAVASGTLTVTINQSLLQSLVPAVTPQLLTLFQAIFLSPGVLELPARYSYAVTLS